MNHGMPLRPTLRETAVAVAFHVVIVPLFIMTLMLALVAVPVPTASLLSVIVAAIMIRLIVRWFSRFPASG
jgi:hypothetical protein